MTISANGVTIRDHESGIEAALLPAICIDGVWHRASAGSGQATEPGTWRFSIGEHGDVDVITDVPTFVLRFVATAERDFQGVGLEGTAWVPGAHAWLSNGFHSWSQTGVITLGAQPQPEDLQTALLQRGDAEVVRGGSELSWWMTWIGSEHANLFAGALTAARFRSWVTAWLTEQETVGLRIACGGSGESIRMRAGEGIVSERFHIEAGRDLHAILRRYADALPSRRRTVVHAPRAGWNSWYGLWDDGVTEDAVLENARLARPILERIVSSNVEPLHIVIDDGWQQQWGDWQTNDKFPAGLAGVCSSLAQQGFATGLWLAPLLAHENSRVATQHPDWFVEGAEYLHGKRGRMLILDVTRSDVAEHLACVIRSVLDAGIRFLKLDFLFAGTFEGRRARNATGMEAYAQAMKILRKAAGDTFVLAVGAPMLGTFEYADSYRIGFDIALEKVGNIGIGPSWPFIANQARSLAARWHLGHATLCDADPVLLRELPAAEVEAGAWMPALAGGAFFLSDHLPALPDERRAWLTPSPVALALSSRPSAPERLYPDNPPDELRNAVVDHFLGRCDQRVPSVWHTADGRRVVVNVADEEAVVEGTRIQRHCAAVLSAARR
ncbi:MAG TPA: glycoside hydrolase family 36 protein [Candidatus Binatia bacterium]|nr:glycoside hydrolase family 36 protein [Candidatus Binatia bacterium]